MVIKAGLEKNARREPTSPLNFAFPASIGSSTFPPELGGPEAVVVAVKMEFKRAKAALYAYVERGGDLEHVLAYRRSTARLHRTACVSYLVAIAVIG
jgi:hypothetical protein